MRAGAPGPSLRVALAHEWLVTLGGSDRVLLALHHLYPDAPIFVSLYDPRRLPPAYAGLPVFPSFLQRLPGATRYHRSLVPLMPAAYGRFRLRGFDVVISSSHACAKGIVAGGAVHICYCHTPMRYAWDLQDEYLRGFSPALRPLVRKMLDWLRRWDVDTAGRVDHFIANSRFVAERIRRHYGREATVIHPPVDTGFFTPGSGSAPAPEAPPTPEATRGSAPAPDGGGGPGGGRAASGTDATEGIGSGPGSGATQGTGKGTGGYFLVASRLVPYKRTELAVQACTLLRLPLVVVGEGPEAGRLRSMAGPTVRFVGEVDDVTLREYYRGCTALIFPGIEDFGLVPVEAQACGRPVIAYGGGGALESVVPGVSGLFFREQTVDSLTDALRSFEVEAFHPEAIRRHAERFSTERFHREIQAFVQRALTTPFPAPGISLRQA